MAWRDGAGCAGRIEMAKGLAAVEVERVGAHGAVPPVEELREPVLLRVPRCRSGERTAR